MNRTTTLSDNQVTDQSQYILSPAPVNENICLPDGFLIVSQAKVRQKRQHQKKALPPSEAPTPDTYYYNCFKRFNIKSDVLCESSYQHLQTCGVSSKSNCEGRNCFNTGEMLVKAPARTTATHTSTHPPTPVKQQMRCQTRLR